MIPYHLTRKAMADQISSMLADAAILTTRAGVLESIGYRGTAKRYRDKAAGLRENAERLEQRTNERSN